MFIRALISAFLRAPLGGRPTFLPLSFKHLAFTALQLVAATPQEWGNKIKKPTKKIRFFSFRFTTGIGLRKGVLKGASSQLTRKATHSGLHLHLS